MAFRSGSYLKIWEITPGDRSTKIRCSSSRKNKQTNEYEQDFSGYVTLAGTAHRDASNLKAGDSVRIGDCEVTSRYDKEKKKEYINFTVFSFAGGAQNDSPAEKPSTTQATNSAPSMDEDEALPF